MTLKELNAEWKRQRLEILVETLKEWSAKETTSAAETDWCDGFAAGNNSAKELIKGLLEILQQQI